MKQVTPLQKSCRSGLGPYPIPISIDFVRICHPFSNITNDFLIHSVLSYFSNLFRPIHIPFGKSCHSGLSPCSTSISSDFSRSSYPFTTVNSGFAINSILPVFLSSASLVYLSNIIIPAGWQPYSILISSKVIWIC